MPKVLLTAAQRAADLEAKRQREFVRIINERKDDGLSHKSLALAVGVSPATISDWKNNCGQMTIRFLRKLIDVAYLTDDEILRIIKGKSA